MYEITIIKKRACVCVRERVRERVCDVSGVFENYNEIKIVIQHLTLNFKRICNGQLKKKQLNYHSKISENH